MMKTCFECGSTENIEDHHVVPRSKGGKKTIPLCARCHDKVHDRYRSKITSSQLIKEALKKVKKRGVVLGRPNKINDKKAKVQKLRSKGLSLRAIAKETKMSVGSVRNCLKL